MANINKIKLSGTTYSIQDENATKTVELTQAQYDALAVKDPNTFYVITDAQGVDLSNYYTKSETSGATEISTALNAKADTATTYTKTETDNAITAATSTKQDTLISGTNIKTINNESILGSGNIDIQGGGGKELSGGTNISITTGETADTINCTLPYYIDSGNCWTIFGDSSANSNKSTGTYDSVYIGYNNEIKNTNISITRKTQKNILIGWNNKLDSYYNSSGLGFNAIIGHGNTLSGSNNIRESYVIGSYNTGHTSYEFICGWSNEVRNSHETSFGYYNNSVSASTTFGDSGNTLFSVGNGTVDARHNAFEIRQNGDIYCSDGTNDVKLQDTITATTANTTALGGLSLVKLTQSEYDALSTKDSNTLYVIVN